MLKRIVLLFALLCAGIAPSAAQLTTSGVGGGFGPAGGGGGYTGPGDIVSGAVVWYGLRAYNAAQATAGFHAINVCLAGNTSCVDMVVNSSGNLVITTVGGMSCSVATCLIHTFYDQSGANACTGSPCDALQNTSADQPILVPSCIGSLPCIHVASGGVVGFQTTANFSTSTTSGFSMTGYGGLGGTFTTSNMQFISCNNNFSALGANFVSSAEFYIYGGASPYLTVMPFTSGNHTMVGVANGASSALLIDGTVTTGTATLGTTCAGGLLNVYFQTTGQLFTGTETGMWTTLFNSTQYNAMSSNISSYW